MMKTTNQYMLNLTTNWSEHSVFSIGFINGISSKCGNLINAFSKRHGSGGRTKEERLAAHAQVMNSVPQGGWRAPNDKRADLIITVPFTSYQWSVFVGWIITDGCLRVASYSKDYPGNENTATWRSWRLRIRQTEAFLAKWLHNAFSLYYAGNPIKLVLEKSPKSKNDRGYNLVWVANSFPVDCLALLGRIIYPEAKRNLLNVKRLPKDAIEQYFDELSLVVAFCCDGNKHEYGYVINLTELSREDIEWFADFLNRRFGFSCSLWEQRNGHVVYIKADSRAKFEQIILKYPELKEAYGYKLIGA